MKKKERRLRELVQQPGSKAICFKFLDRWYCVTYPYRYKKNLVILPGGKSLAGSVIVQGPSSLGKAIRLLHGRRISLKLKQLIYSLLE